MLPHRNPSVRALPQEVAERDLHAALIARFGEKAVELWRGARHRQSLLAPTSIGAARDGEGNSIAIAIGINGETIVDADFDAEGCLSSEIAAATAAFCVQGKSLDEAAALDDLAILATVGPFPKEDRRFTALAALAVRKAVARWLKKTDLGHKN